MTYRLTRKAEKDVIAIYRPGARTFGLTQVELD